MTTISKHQKTEQVVLRLQWRRALMSLQLAVHMSQRAGPDGIEAELAQLAELAEQAARLKDT